MDLKLVILILLSLGVALVGCAEEDACKPRDIAFCLDEHRIWKCAPDGNPEDGIPPYTIQIIDCRTYASRQKTYCVTNFWEDGTRGSTYCRAEPRRSSDNREDVGTDVEADTD